eukprot:356041-Chlamydomonas_euryale.AAC.7
MRPQRDVAPVAGAATLMTQVWMLSRALAIMHQGHCANECFNQVKRFERFETAPTRRLTTTARRTFQPSFCYAESVDHPAQAPALFNGLSLVTASAGACKCLQTLQCRRSAVRESPCGA